MADRRTMRGTVGLTILAVLLARVALIYTSPGHGYDQLVFWRWADALAHHSLGAFYAVVPDADHLPGDLYVHAALARVADASQALQDPGRYMLLVKWCALAFDVVLAALTYKLVRQGGRRQEAARPSRPGWSSSLHPA